MLKVNLPGEGEVVVAAAAASKGEVKESTGGVAHCISARVVGVFKVKNVEKSLAYFAVSCNLGAPRNS